MSASEYHIVINPGYIGSDSLRRLIESLPESFDQVGNLIFKKRNEVRLLEDNYGFPHLTGIAIKRFKSPGWLRGAFYTYVGKTKAHRAYFNALELLKRGVDTPEPIAYIEGKKGGVKQIGYLVTGKTDYPSIKEDLYYEDRFDAEVGQAYGSFVALLHSKGILHRDLNCDNVLIDKTGAVPRFTVIDVNRMTFIAKGKEFTGKQRMRNLCLFTRSVANVRKVAEAYAMHAGLPKAFSEETARYKRIFNSRRERKKRISGLFKKKTATTL